MTRREKVVAIATDVLKSLRQLNAREGVYCIPRNSATSQVRYDVGIKSKTREVAEKLKRGCEVDAVGACFLSSISLFGNYDLTTQVFNYGTSLDQVHARLGNVIGVNQLVLIEAAFETDGQMPLRTCLQNTVKNTDVTAAVAFGNRFPDPKQRLRAIMKNVIANGGKFVPTAR